MPLVIAPPQTRVCTLLTERVLASSTSNLQSRLSPVCSCRAVTPQIIQQSRSSAVHCLPPPGTSTASNAPTYLSCSIADVTAEVAEELSDILLGYGAQSVAIEEHRPEGAAEEEVYDDGSNQLWRHCTIVATFADGFDLSEALEIAHEVVGRQQLGEEVKRVDATGWEEAVRASYVPLKVAEGVWIVPEWSTPLEPDALNIILQPGVAFGTGEHPTTRLCLEALLQAELKGTSVCDYGTGSGVLGIAALLRGAASAVGVDVDPLSVRVAACNAGLSGVASRFQAVQCGPSLSDDDPLAAEEGSGPRQFDLVVANILRGPLLDLAPRLAAYTRPGGRLLLSGILVHQVSGIQKAYQQHFRDFNVTVDASWALITATRHCP